MTKVRYSTIQVQTSVEKRRYPQQDPQTIQEPMSEICVICIHIAIPIISYIRNIRHSPKFKSPQSRHLPYWYCVWSVNEGFYREEIGSVGGIGGLREATGPCESRSEGEREGKRKGMVGVKMRRDRFSDDGLVIVNLDMYTGSWGIPEIVN